MIGLTLGKHRQYEPNEILLHAYTVWLAVAGVILVICGAYFWRKPVLNQLAVVLLILLLPPISGDYTLVDL